MAENLVLIQLRNMGLASVSEISYLRSPKVKDGVAKAVQRLKKSGQIEEVEIQSDRYLKLVETTNKNDISDQIQILSPFDNLVIQRKRLKHFFMFDYQVECYVPANKRLFGYFCLPILKGNQLIGRVDAKAHRQEGKFEIKNIFFERGIKPTVNLKQ